MSTTIHQFIDNNCDGMRLVKREIPKDKNVQLAFCECCLKNVNISMLRNIDGDKLCFHCYFEVAEVRKSLYSTEGSCHNRDDRENSVFIKCANKNKKATIDFYAKKYPLVEIIDTDDHELLAIIHESGIKSAKKN